MLAEPDPAWSSLYSRQEERIRVTLGARAIRLEHVGSTSVPGLAAKPVIDVVLIVAGSAAEDDYLADLEAAGLTLQFREPGWYEHRFLRDHNLTSRCMCSPKAARRLIGCCASAIGCALGRARDLYERTKRDLAARHWTTSATPTPRVLDRGLHHRQGPQRSDRSTRIRWVK